MSKAKIQVLWPSTEAAEVTITAGSTVAFTVDGVAVAFPYVLTSSTLFETVNSDTYTISVKSNGREIASTPDGTRTVELQRGQSFVFAPDADTGATSIPVVPQFSPLASGESTIPRGLVVANALAVGSQTLRLTYFTATKTESVTQVKMVSGATAAGATPTLVRIGVYSVDPVTGGLTLVASTPNDTTLLAATGTAYTKSLSAPWAKVAGQRYAIGLLVVTGATAPTMAGQATSTLPAAEMAVPPRLCATVGSQADLPSSIAAGSLAATTQVFYAAVTP